MENRSADPTRPSLLTVGALAALLMAAPGEAVAHLAPEPVVESSAATGGSAGVSSASASDPCPKTVEMDGRTGYLGGYVCGTVSVGVGGNVGPFSVGFTLGHCTGCECSYVTDREVGMQFTRTAAAACGWWGAGSGVGSGGSDGPDELQSGSGETGGCVWGRDYIGWEPRGC